MSSALWATHDPSAWAAALAGYSSAVLRKKEPFHALDRWYTQELPLAVATRAPLSIVKAELVQLVEWKLLRGKWRPRLLDYAQQQEEGGVQQASESAFKELDGCTGIPGDKARIKVALEHLTRLKGVGPATASAILAAACPHAPFMSDEALEVVMGKRDYTVPAYLAFMEAMQQLARQVNAAPKPKAASASSAAESSDDGPVVWTASLCEQALWAASMMGKASASVPVPEEQGREIKTGGKQTAPGPSKRAKRAK